MEKKSRPKNAHLQAKVDPARIFNALNFLRQSGNKHYLQTQSSEEYKKRCQNEDPEGYNLIFGQDNSHNGRLRLEFIPDGAAEPVLNLKTFLEINEYQNLEKEYREDENTK
jgi:hypothetical protein